MSVIGTWTLHFDWGCGGTYGSASITLNANGTFASAPYTGKWVENAGKIIWRFDQAPNSIYAGDDIDNAMLGISTTFGANGCWYALRGTAAVAEARKPTLDVAGNEPGRK